MTPEFRITADSRDITAVLRDRLLSLRLHDAAGLASDTCEIVLDDRSPSIALPRTGAALTVALGYRETGLVVMGRWIVDEIAAAGWPATLTIRARAADLRAGLKASRERSWPDGATLGEVVATIAGEHGFEPAVGVELAGIVPPHIDQTESDLNLLTRLGKEYDAVAKAAGGRLLFVSQAMAKSVSGRPLARIAINGQALSRYEITLAERGKYGAVMANWHDVTAGERIPVKVGNGEPVKTLRRTYPDEAAARVAAESSLSALDRGAATLRGACPGDTRLMAEARLVISGVRPGVNGEWSVTSVGHIYDGQGYHCDFEAEPPGETSKDEQS